MDLDLPGEEWRSVGRGLPYEVSNKGRVRRSEDGTATYKGRVLKPRIIGDPTRGQSVQVVLRGRGVMVAHLVAVAFGSPPSGDWRIAHIDDDPMNNEVDNLVWRKHLPPWHPDYGVESIPVVSPQTKGQRHAG